MKLVKNCTTAAKQTAATFEVTLFDNWSRELVKVSGYVDYNKHGARLYTYLEYSNPRKVSLLTEEIFSEVPSKKIIEKKFSKVLKDRFDYIEGFIIRFSEKFDARSNVGYSIHVPPRR